MRRAAVLVSVLFAAYAGAAALASPASATYCSSTPAAPICTVAGGSSTPTVDGAFDATLVPGRSPYTPPSGAPSTWTGQAEGAIWQGARQAGQAPGASSWGPSMIGGAIGSVAGYAAFQTGLYIGGAIAKRYIFSGYDPGVPTSGLATSMDPAWKFNYVRQESVNQYCGPTANIPIGDWCLQFNTGSAGYYNGFNHNDFTDVGVCGSYSSTASSEGYTGTACGFTNDTAKSLAVEEYATAMGILNDPRVGRYWHVRQNVAPGSGTPNTFGTLQVYTTSAEFESYTAPAPDGAHSTAQSGDTTVSFTPTSITTSSRQAAATTITNIYDSGDPAGKAAVDRENCAMDVTYCPGGANYPNTMALPQPLTNETYSAYATRLTAAGFLGNVTNTQEPADLNGYGPLAVTRIVQGAQVYDPNAWPGSAPIVDTYATITLRYNSSSASPSPTAGGGTGSGGTSCGTVGSPCHSVIDSGGTVTGGATSIDLSPLQVDFGCSFPFGLFCYAQTVTGWFNVSPAAPDFSFSLPGFNVGGASLTSSNTYDVSLSSIDSYMATIRAILAVAVYVGAAWMLATRLLGLQTGDPGAAVDDGAPL